MGNTANQIKKNIFDVIHTFGNGVPWQVGFFAKKEKKIF